MAVFSVDHYSMDVFSMDVFTKYECNATAMGIRQHWIQRITFAAETNATCLQSWLGGYTEHTDAEHHNTISTR